RACQTGSRCEAVAASVRPHRSDKDHHRDLRLVARRDTTRGETNHPQTEPGDARTAFDCPSAVELQRRSPPRAILTHVRAASRAGQSHDTNAGGPTSLSTCSVLAVAKKLRRQRLPAPSTPDSSRCPDKPRR